MKNYNTIPSKPIAPTNHDETRWNENALRKRLLTGEYFQDLEDELYRHLPTDRREAWGVADESSNPFEQVTRQLATLYHEQPQITNSEGDIQKLVGREGYVQKAGLFSLMQRFQQFTLGIRECIMRIDIAHTPTNQPGVNYRVVTPDFVYMEASQDMPDTPLLYMELRLREDEKKELIWVYDYIDIRDENNPIFGMYKAESDGNIGKDMSELYMGHEAMKGESYPFRDSQNKPFLPLVLYHAQKTGYLWNSFDNRPLVSGTMTSMVLFSMFVHCVRDCSHPQRYIAGLQISGLSSLDTDLTSRRQSISTDPSSILVFHQDLDATSQPLIGQFQAGADPKELLEAIASYEYRVAVSAGISPSELTRTSSDPRSGYSLSVSRAGQREYSRAMAPIFRKYDEELLTKTAMLCNRYLNTNLPERGYRVHYQTLQLSPEELKAIREDVIQKMGAGLMSPLDAIKAMYPDLDETGAREKLLQIRRERAEFI